MPSRRGKSKRRQKSKLRSQSQHLEQQQKPVLQQSIEKKEETEEKLEDSSPKKSVLLEHYARTVQQRSLVEVALLCLLFNSNEIMASSWKLGDLSKSLFGFLLGGKNDDQNDKKEDSLPIKNSYSSSPSKPAAAKVVQETPQTMPRRKKRTSELQKETPPKQLLQKSLKDKEVKDENESSNTGVAGRESCEDSSAAAAGFVTAPPKPAVEKLRNSLLVTDISSELTSNSKGEEDFPTPTAAALPPSSVPSKSSTHEDEETVIKNELSERTTENCQEFEDQENSTTIVVLPSSTTVKETEVVKEMTEISDKKEDNDAFTHDCNLNNPQNTFDLSEPEPSSSKAAMIPAPPPPPPPGFLAPEKVSSGLKTEKEKEKLPKVSPAEKALLRQLESIDDPTFKSFLSGQLKVKSSSRDRRETQNEM